MTASKRGQGSRATPQKAVADSAADDNQARQRIITAAAQIFASKGFAGAAIREIALEADVTHQLIAYYYGGKEDLWWAVVEAEMDRVLGMYSAIYNATASKPPEERFRRCVKALVDYEAKFNGLARLMLQEALAKSSRYLKLLGHRKLAGADPITKFLEDAHKEGILIEMPVEELKLNFLSLITHRYIIDQHASLILGRPVRSEAAIKRHANIISDMFLRSSR